MEEMFIKTLKVVELLPCFSEALNLSTITAKKRKLLKRS
jgi:hypothetical protein